MSKDNAEKKVLKSLDDAISDFAKNELPSNFLEVAEITVVSKVSEKKIKKAKITKVRAGAKKSNKDNKINTFYRQDSKVSRETRIRKSPYWFSKNLFNFYNTKKKSLATALLVVVALGFVLATTYVTYAYVTAANNDLINNVAKHIIIPINEIPKVYIVQSEKADIFSNPSFKGLQVGDNVLTYTNSGKIVIYRSKEDKIVNIVNLQN